MRSPTVIGLELPGPGNSVFQARFLSALHLTGRSFSLDVPSPSGPRNCGQSPPAPGGAATRTENRHNETEVKLVWRIIGVALALLFCPNHLPLYSIAFPVPRETVLVADWPVDARAP